VVARDFGFAPNPFYGLCTLATCKPNIRRTAQIGDWIIGTGSKSSGRGGHLVYAMKVTESMTFDEYWCNARFRDKRPTLRGSKKQAFGDNIYHRDAKGRWIQENSHHSLQDGSPNLENIDHDTRVDRVLISDRYMYWGADGPAVPSRFRDYDGLDVCLGRQGHRCNFPDQLVMEFIAWLEGLGSEGYVGRPYDW
jgi:Nucleotide modification associated domain 2